MAYIMPEGASLLIRINAELNYAARGDSEILLQVEAAVSDTQICESSSLVIDPDIQWAVTAGEEQIGCRRWGTVNGAFTCVYQADIRVNRSAVNLATLAADPLRRLPEQVVKFLMPSRYCHPEAFFNTVPDLFGTATGGPLIALISDWIASNFTYDNGVSTSATDATTTFDARAGVCRDYAHVLIAMARSAGIPARIASVYAPDVTPQDFHAVAEVFLDGSWHLVDPTGMAQAPEMVLIGVGRDAADVSFLTSYGWLDLHAQSVGVLRA